LIFAISSGFSEDTAMADISLGEKLHDIRDKVGTVYNVVSRMLPGGEFQMSTASIRGAPPVKVFKTLPPAIGNYYRGFFKQFEAKPWIHYEGEVYTFAQAQVIQDAVGAELVTTFGVKPGDAVGIFMKNLPEFLMAFVAITAVGAVAVPLNAMWGTDEVKYAIGDSGAKIVFCDPQRAALCQPFVDELGVQMILCRGESVTEGTFGGAPHWEQLVEQGKDKPQPSLASVQADDDCMIMYTSGTTGFPKGVVHTQRSVGTAVKLGHLVAVAIPEADPKSLLAVPMFHITALCNVFLHSISGGHQIAMLRKWDAGEALKIIESMKISRFTGVPTMVNDMMEHPDFTPQRIASVKNMISGGAPVPPAQVAKMRQKTKTSASAQGYGLTETMGGVIINKGIDYLKHPTSCGKPIPFMVEAGILAPDGQKMKAGERGELCIRSAVNMARYHNRPEDTAKAVDSQGWFHSGDVAKIEGGFVYILDRLKDIIIRGGENIDCSEVEAALYSNPAVRECSVFGVPDERLGEVVGCAVWLSEPITSAELSAHCASKLAKFKVPLAQHIFVVDAELPKGATGKIDKKGLREMYKGGAPASRL